MVSVMDPRNNKVYVNSTISDKKFSDHYELRKKVYARGDFFEIK